MTDGVPHYLWYWKRNVNDMSTLESHVNSLDCLESDYVTHDHGVLRIRLGVDGDGIIFGQIVSSRTTWCPGEYLLLSGAYRAMLMIITDDGYLSGGHDWERSQFFEISQLVEECCQ